MKAIEIKPNVYWVGGIDWDVRYFHGYKTPRGTTYNAYLIMDEKITLVDTVKHHFSEEMISRIKDVVDPAKIDYVVSNHVECDHSGGLPAIMDLATNATLVTSPKGKKGLTRYYKKDWNFQEVKSGDTLNIGKLNLTFVQVPMVHWPDSMVTYIPELKLLLPNDAFGQHIASAGRFDDEIGWEILKEEAQTYYANIVLPYGENVLKALEVVAGLDIDMVAPSHGVIWRTYIDKIVPEYLKWAGNISEKKALIVYDTMWNSTAQMAKALQEGLEEGGLEVMVRFLQTSHMSEIMTDLITSKAILVGSPTLNNGMLPSVSGFLTYVEGLRPKNRMGLAFGSYGWGGQGAKFVQAVLERMGWETPMEMINLNYRPDPEELAAVKEKGKEFAKLILAAE